MAELTEADLAVVDEHLLAYELDEFIELVPCLVAEVRRLQAEKKRLLGASRWLVEMAGYAAPHVSEEWARRGGTGNSNAGDLFNAISEAQAVIQDLEANNG